jgi:hypothetical protein
MPQPSMLLHAPITVSCSLHVAVSLAERQKNRLKLQLHNLPPDEEFYRCDKATYRQQPLVSGALPFQLQRDALLPHYEQNGYVFSVETAERKHVGKAVGRIDTAVVLTIVPNRNQLRGTLNKFNNGEHGNP